MSAIIVDIESCEWCKEFNNLNKFPPEHPRASTTDDVECFFSILTDMVGKLFIHKQVLKLSKTLNCGNIYFFLLFFRQCLNGGSHVKNNPREWILTFLTIIIPLHIIDFMRGNFQNL